MKNLTFLMEEGGGGNKLNKNCTLNEEFDFLGVKGAVEEGGLSRSQKLKKKTSYRTMVSIHTENFNIPAWGMGGGNRGNV